MQYGSPPVLILLLELGEGRREKGIKFLDSAFSGGVVLFPVSRREERILEFSFLNCD